MLKINKVSYYYKKEKPLFDGLTLNYERGGIYGLLGMNGAGKSTLMYLIMGMLFPKEGKVTCGGIDTKGGNPDALAEMFLVPEEIAYPSCKIEVFVERMSEFYPRFDRSVFDHCINTFGIGTKDSFSSMSMGTRKKVYLSVALAANTKVLLMDEPTNGLDIISKTQFRQLVAECASDDKVFLITTHQVKDVENLIEHISIIREGQILLDAPVSEIGSKLTFAQVGASELPSDTIYSEPSMGGNLAVMPNESGEENSIDIELLFKAAMSQPETIKSLFNKQ